MLARTPCLPMLSGKPMPQVGLGTYPSRGEELQAAIRIAIEAGYRHIDTATLYLNQGDVGEVLEEAIKTGTVTRDEMFITTKLTGAAAEPSVVREQCELSLKLLRTDYIDLLLIHFPIVFSTEKLYDDPPSYFPTDKDGNYMASDAEPLDSYREMEKLVDAGLVKAIGLSNFNKKQVQRIWDSARIKPANLQCECHAWFPQDELVDFCTEKGITFSAYAPIGSPGRSMPVKAEDCDVLMKDPVVVGLAKKLNKTPAQILLKHLLQRGIIVLPKSVTKERIVSNFQLFDFMLSDADMEAMKGINREKRFFSFSFLKSLLDHPGFPWKVQE